MSRAIRTADIAKRLGLRLTEELKQEITVGFDRMADVKKGGEDWDHYAVWVAGYLMGRCHGQWRDPFREPQRSATRQAMIDDRVMGKKAG